MNSNPFVYYKPESKDELVHLIKELVAVKKSYALYAGGTELVTMFRQGKGLVEAVVDLKGISELTEITQNGKVITIGSAVTLNQVIDVFESKSVKKALSAIADHSVRNKLTIGGNICGRLPYREAILPMLCRGAILTVLENDTLVCYEIGEIFDKRLKLNPNAVLWSVEINTDELAFEMSQRYTATTEIDYPIIHHYTSLNEGILKIALSGFSSFPIVSYFDYKDFQMAEDKLDFLMAPFKTQVKSDDRSSSEYRLSLLKVCTEEILKALAGKEGQHD